MNDELLACIDRLQAWIEIDSVTPGERTYLEALEAHFRAAGYDCERQPIAADRWNLIATRTPNPRLFFCTHVDTVPPFFGATRTEEAIYGRGACDTKGGLVAMDAAASRLCAEGLDDLGFILVVGEEVDHRGAKESQPLQAKFSPERVILCEPTVNHVVSAQKGMLKVWLNATGTAAHSAYPARGVSAVHRLLDTIAAIRAEPWPSDAVLGPTTLNVGRIEGGVAANVFAPWATAEVLFRAVSPVDALIGRVHELCGEGVTAKIGPHNDPVFFDPPEDVETTTVAFNTDASYLTGFGPIWLVGPGDIEVAHTDHEHISYAQLAEGIDLYVRLGREVLG